MSHSAFFLCVQKSGLSVSAPPKLRNGSHSTQGHSEGAQPWCHQGFCLELLMQMLFFPAAVGGSRQSILGFCNLFDLGVDHVWAVYAP